MIAFGHLEWRKKIVEIPKKNRKKNESNSSWTSVEPYGAK